MAVRLVLYDAHGREVATLAEGFRAAGEYRVPWQAEGRPSGLYVARLEGPAFTLARTMVLLR